MIRGHTSWSPVGRGRGDDDVPCGNGSETLHTMNETNPAVRYAAQDGIGYVTMNRPERRNAMDDDLLVGLAEALRAAQTDPVSRVVVLRGAGPVFCAGGDVHDMARHRPEEEYRATRLRLERAVARAAHDLGKPLIAQIQGAAIGGGCVLAALCDLRVAADDTTFMLPEVAYGSVASMGGIYMLSRIVGLGRAFELLYLVEKFDARRALEIGLVNRVVSAESLERDTATMARAIGENFGRELRLTRDAILRGLGLDFPSAADLETEAAMQAHLGGDVEAGFERARQRMRGKARQG